MVKRGLEKPGQRNWDTARTIMYKYKLCPECSYIRELYPHFKLKSGKRIVFNRHEFMFALAVFAQIPESLLKMRLSLSEESALMVQKIFGVEALLFLSYEYNCASKLGETLLL